MTDLPAVLNDLTIDWSGVDSTTPAGCTLATAVHLGIPTTYVIRDGQVIGRIEISRGQQTGYAGERLKGGYLVGYGDSQTLAERIAAFNR